MVNSLTPPVLTVRTIHNLNDTLFGASLPYLAYPTTLKLSHSLTRLGGWASSVCLASNPPHPPQSPSLIHTSMQSSTVRSHSPFGDSALSPQQSSTVANYTMASASGRSSSAASGRSQSAKSVVCRLSIIVISLFLQNLSLCSQDRAGHQDAGANTVTSS